MIPTRAVILDGADGGYAGARALRRRGVPVTMISKGWVTRARGIDGRRATTRDQWLAELSDVGSRGPGVLIPASDPAIEFVAKERDRIPASLRSFEGPDSAHAKLMDKGSLYTLAAEAGLRVPVVKLLTSRDQLDEVAAGAAYPSLLKPTLSHRYRELFGHHRNILVHSPEELRSAATPALDAGIEWLVTELIPGPETNLFGAVTIRLEDGSYPLAYTRRKLRQHPPYFGAGSVLETVPAPGAMEMSKRLLESTGFVGFSSLEAKRHEVTGEHVLMEINVRIPQNLGLGEAAGVEPSWRLYAALAGIARPAAAASARRGEGDRPESGAHGGAGVRASGRYDDPRRAGLLPRGAKRQRPRPDRPPSTLGLLRRPRLSRRAWRDGQAEGEGRGLHPQASPAGRGSEEGAAGLGAAHGQAPVLPGGGQPGTARHAGRGAAPGGRRQPPAGITPLRRRCSNGQRTT